MEISASSKRIFAVTIPLFVGFVILMAVLAFIPHPSCHDDPSEQVNIVFDKTKYYSKTQAHSVDGTLVEVLIRAADNAEINLFFITRDSARPYLVLSECKPTTHGNPLFVNVEEQQNAFRSIVVDEVKRKIDIHMQFPSSAPILESLATIMRERRVTSKIEAKKSVEFDIYSDMVQESKNVSLVPKQRLGGTDFGVDATTCTPSSLVTNAGFSDTYSDINRFFRDVSVHVYGIHRDPATSPRYPGERCVRAFWEPTFPHLTWMTL